MTKKKVRIIATCCWLAAILWILPSFALIEYNTKKHACAWRFATEFQHKTYRVGCLIVAGAIPIGIMTCLYSKVVYVLWIKRSREDLGSRQMAIVRARQRVTKVVITITVFYSLCWLPNLVQLLDTRLGFRGHRISILLVTLNSSVNPLLYTLQSEPFRRNLKNLFCFRKTKIAHFPGRGFVPGN